jgi:Transposase
MKSKKRRHFPDAFKREALERARASGLTIMRVAEELGLHETVLRRWMRRVDPPETDPARDRNGTCYACAALSQRGPENRHFVSPGRAALVLLAVTALAGASKRRRGRGPFRLAVVVEVGAAPRSSVPPATAQTGEAGKKHRHRSGQRNRSRRV